jgi:hypothetical protein
MTTKKTILSLPFLFLSLSFNACAAQAQQRGIGSLLSDAQEQVSNLQQLAPPQPKNYRQELLAYAANKKTVTTGNWFSRRRAISAVRAFENKTIGGVVSMLNLPKEEQLPVFGLLADKVIDEGGLNDDFKSFMSGAAHGQKNASVDKLRDFWHTKVCLQRKAVEQQMYSEGQLLMVAKKVTVFGAVKGFILGYLGQQPLMGNLTAISKCFSKQRYIAIARQNSTKMTWTRTIFSAPIRYVFNHLDTAANALAFVFAETGFPDASKKVQVDFFHKWKVRFLCGDVDKMLPEEAKTAMKWIGLGLGLVSTVALGIQIMPVLASIAAAMGTAAAAATAAVVLAAGLAAAAVTAAVTYGAWFAMDFFGAPTWLALAVCVGVMIASSLLCWWKISNYIKRKKEDALATKVAKKVEEVVAQKKATTSTWRWFWESTAAGSPVQKTPVPPKKGYSKKKKGAAIFGLVLAVTALYVAVKSYGATGVAVAPVLHDNTTHEEEGPLDEVIDVLPPSNNIEEEDEDDDGVLFEQNPHEDAVEVRESPSLLNRQVGSTMKVKEVILNIHDDVYRDEQDEKEEDDYDRLEREKRERNAAALQRMKEAQKKRAAEKKNAQS